MTQGQSTVRVVHTRVTQSASMFVFSWSHVKSWEFLWDLKPGILTVVQCKHQVCSPDSSVFSHYYNFKNCFNLSEIRNPYIIHHTLCRKPNELGTRLLLYCWQKRPCLHVAGVKIVSNACLWLEHPTCNCWLKSRTSRELNVWLLLQKKLVYWLYCTFGFIEKPEWPVRWLIAPRRTAR